MNELIYLCSVYFIQNTIERHMLLKRKWAIDKLLVMNLPPLQPEGFYNVVKIRQR